MSGCAEGFPVARSVGGVLCSDLGQQLGTEVVENHPVAMGERDTVFAVVEQHTAVVGFGTEDTVDVGSLEGQEHAY